MPRQADTFRTINDRTIFWRDKKGVVHACEGADVHRGVRLIWTLCKRDVPANASYTTDGPEFVTCDVCAKAEGRVAGEEQVRSPVIRASEHPL
jgi:hypothetical protein